MRQARRYTDCIPAPTGSLTLLIIFLFTYITFSAAQGGWIQKASMPGNFRVGMVGFSLGFKGYICAGSFGALSSSADCHVYDPVSNSWDVRAPVLLPIRAGAGCGAYGYGFITTGMNEVIYITGLYRYDPVNDQWDTAAPFPGDIRLFASGFGLGNKAYIFGGVDVTVTSLGDLWEYDAGLNTWAQKAPFPFGGRSNATVFTIGGDAYVLGGDDGNSVLNDLWRYSPSANTWTMCASLPASPRTDAMAFSIGYKAYVVCGWSDQGLPLYDCWRYDASLNSWTQLPDFPGSPTTAGTSFTINDKGFVVGGYQSTECWMYDPAISGIEETRPSEISIFPDPAGDVIYISSENNLELSIRICDFSGRNLVHDCLQLSRYGREAISLAQLRDGLYFIRVTDLNGDIMLHRKFIKR